MSALEPFVAARPHLGGPLPELGRGPRFQELAVRAHAILGRVPGKPPAIVADAWARSYGYPPHPNWFGARFSDAELVSLAGFMRGKRLDPGDADLIARIRASLAAGVPALVTHRTRATFLVGETDGAWLELDPDSGETSPLHLSDAIDILSVVEGLDFLSK